HATSTFALSTLSLHDALPIFFFQHFRRDFVARNVTRLSRRDMHRNVFNELLKFFAARNEISFAVYFYQDADFPPHMNVRTDHARSEEHTSELQSRGHLVCRLL